MYDPIVGKYVLDNWEEITSVVKIKEVLLKKSRRIQWVKTKKNKPLYTYVNSYRYIARPCWLC